MSGGSQHNPNGRQSQLGPGWSPLQLQMANLLARAPQAHMASDRGVTWHTPTPPPHLYHVPAPSPPDPLQAMKNAGSNSVFRHTATPPELFRHTPTPPDKHHMRSVRLTPSPGDVKSGVPMPPVDLYPHLGSGRDKVVRAEDLLAYARVGVDLSVSGARANGGGALSVRDAPTINSLVGRSAGRPPHARVDALLERLAPASPHSVIVHSRVAPTPSPPSSNEDSADSCGAPPGSKRKRKPERTVRVPVPPPLAPPAPASPPRAAPPLHNGDVTPDKPPSPPPPEPHTRRKTRSGSAETIDDIAAMIASTDRTTEPEPDPPAPPEPEPVVTVDKLESILASPEPDKPPEEPEPEPAPEPVPVAEPAPCAPAAPRRRSLRTSNPDAPNVPVESPSEAKPAEPDATEARSAEPTASTYVDVENQLEKMFAGLDGNKSEPDSTRPPEVIQDIPATPAVAKKRRKSAPARGERRKAPRNDDSYRRKGPRKKSESSRGRKSKDVTTKDAYDSGSNASSSRSRGPYIQIVGPGVRPARSEEERRVSRAAGRSGAVRGLHGSTLGPRYDAATPDASWLCAFCQRGPHRDALGDLFGPYPINDDCDDYRNSESESRVGGACEWVWFHEECGVWAPGVVAAGARVWGLGAAVRAARPLRCDQCARPGPHVACNARACPRRVHLPCARAALWTLHDAHYRAYCPAHAHT